MKRARMDLSKPDSASTLGILCLTLGFAGMIGCSWRPKSEVRFSERAIAGAGIASASVTEGGASSTGVSQASFTKTGFAGPGFAGPGFRKSGAAETDVSPIGAIDGDSPYGPSPYGKLERSNRGSRGSSVASTSGDPVTLNYADPERNHRGSNALGKVGAVTTEPTLERPVASAGKADFRQASYNQDPSAAKSSDSLIELTSPPTPQLPQRAETAFRQDRQGQERLGTESLPTPLQGDRRPSANDSEDRDRADSRGTENAAGGRRQNAADSSADTRESDDAQESNEPQAPDISEFETPLVSAAIDAVIPTEFGRDLGFEDSGLNLQPELVRLENVIASSVQFYPEIQQAIAGRQIASGDLLSANGAFDYKLQGFALALIDGFYENERVSFKAEQPLYGGGFINGGYKYGDGDFQPWYLERETNEGGEFAIGLGVPLARNRTIDERRSTLLQSQLDVVLVEPLIQQQSLMVSLFAANSYWEWVAANAKLSVQRQLLELALTRKEQVEFRIKKGDLPPAAQIDNLRFIASRKAKLVDSQRKVESSAIKLSFYLRDAQGQPILIGRAIEDARFPVTVPLNLNTFFNDQGQALGTRPEFQVLQTQLSQLEIELAQANNLRLPEVNFVADLSKDVGGAASSSRDKTPFEAEGGFAGSWEPWQRKALGKAQAVRGKMLQLQAKRQLTQDKIIAELRDARSALNAAARKVEQAIANVELARQTLDNGRKQFDAGDIDLIILNILEQANADAQTDLIDAQAEYRVALAAYQIAQGQLPETLLGNVAPDEPDADVDRNQAANRPARNADDAEPAADAAVGADGADAGQ